MINRLECSNSKALPNRNWPRDFFFIHRTCPKGQMRNGVNIASDAYSFLTLPGIEPRTLCTRVKDLKHHGVTLLLRQSDYPLWMYFAASDWSTSAVIKLHMNFGKNTIWSVSLAYTLLQIQIFYFQKLSQVKSTGITDLFKRMDTIWTLMCPTRKGEKKLTFPGPTINKFPLKVPRFLDRVFETAERFRCSSAS